MKPPSLSCFAIIMLNICKAAHHIQKILPL